MSYQLTFKNREPIDCVIVMANNPSASFVNYNETLDVTKHNSLSIFFRGDADHATLYDIFNDEVALSEIAISDPETGDFYIYLNYSIPFRFYNERVDGEENIAIYGDKRWVMDLCQLTELEKAMHTMAGKTVKDINYLDFDEYKSYLIDESKSNLAKYLSNHPAELNGEYFTLTEEKQTLFMTQYLAWKEQLAAGITDATFTWNASGSLVAVERDEEWCLSFMQLIKDYVYPLVQTQRAYEAAVNAATTKEILDNLQMPFVESGETT